MEIDDDDNNEDHGDRDEEDNDDIRWSKTNATKIETTTKIKIKFQLIINIF